MKEIRGKNSGEIGRRREKRRSETLNRIKERGRDKETDRGNDKDTTYIKTKEETERERKKVNWK